jgi:hypothetical protein
MATLNVYNNGNQGITPYDGSDQNAYFIILVCDKDTVSLTGFEINGVPRTYRVTVNFDNGVGTGEAELIPVVTVDDGIKGQLRAYHYEDDNNEFCNIRIAFPSHYVRGDGGESIRDFKNDFSIKVNGVTQSLIDPPSGNDDVYGNALYFCFNRNLFTPYEEYEIEIIYTDTTDNRQIKVWVPEDVENAEPPSDAAILPSFNTGIITVIAEEW